MKKFVIVYPRRVHLGYEDAVIGLFSSPEEANDYLKANPGTGPFHILPISLVQ